MTYYAVDHDCERTRLARRTSFANLHNWRGEVPRKYLMKRDSFLDEKFHVIIDTSTLLRPIPINALFALGLDLKVIYK